MEEINKRLIVSNFYEGRNLYEDDLGWQNEQKCEAHSFVSREIFEFEIIRCGLNLSFYCVDNDTFYALHTEGTPIEFKILPRDRNDTFIGNLCSGDTHEDGEVLYSFDKLTMDIWDTIKIEGKSLEDILERSFILALN